MMNLYPYVRSKKNIMIAFANQIEQVIKKKDKYTCLLNKQTVLLVVHTNL